MDILNRDNIQTSAKTFKENSPFQHCVIDGFFNENFARKLSSEIPLYDDQAWYTYNNQIEIKKACNNWNLFPKNTYQTFSFLNSREFLTYLEDILEMTPLYSDMGLNGGGWHIHRSGGRLNPHLDYSVHPKMGLERVVNLIVYLNPNWQEAWGGHFGLWSHSNEEGQPDKLEKEVAPIFNRAVLFNTTQNSWHGISSELNAPNGECRKSIATYYLRPAKDGVSQRGKALFAPTEDQKDNREVLETIKIRSQVDTADRAYRK